MLLVRKNDTKNDLAQDLPAPSSMEQRTRVCLNCREKFQSEWAGNRICKRCRATSIWRQGA